MHEVVAQIQPGSSNVVMLFLCCRV